MIIVISDRIKCHHIVMVVKSVSPCVMHVHTFNSDMCEMRGDLCSGRQKIIILCPLFMRFLWQIYKLWSNYYFLSYTIFDGWDVMWNNFYVMEFVACIDGLQKECKKVFFRSFIAAIKYNPIILINIFFLATTLTRVISSSLRSGMEFGERVFHGEVKKILWNFPNFFSEFSEKKKNLMSFFLKNT